MERLDNPIQRYAWGSATAIPELLGKAPDGGPQAELWLGAHPLAPSRISTGRTLEECIAQAPLRLLGASVHQHFGGRLPFLFKVLAAAQPLSLQAHPSQAQAREGFAREDARGIPRDAPHRNYKDPNHKPEMICALSQFHALCGFRALSDSVRLWRALGLDVQLLEQQGLKAYFQQVMTLPKAAQAALVQQLVSAASKGVAAFDAECALAVRLQKLYPNDVGIVGAMLLNLITLQPGEALYLGAGNLHAYLEGTAVELMANSDNVLRGGLTAKHVDVPELLSVVSFVDGMPDILRPGDGPVWEYRSPAPDFQLSRIVLGTEHSTTLTSKSAQVLLTVNGQLTVQTQGEQLILSTGQSVFIGADEGPTTVTGQGTLFRATVGAVP